MKKIYKNIFLLFIFFTINIFSSKDAIIAPKKYKPAEMNLEITKVKLKEIEGTINEVKKELYISKKDLTVDTDDILFITEEKNKLRENFNFQKKDILNNENYVFSYKQHKNNIYLVHSDKEKIKGIYKINQQTKNPDTNKHAFYIRNTAYSYTISGNLNTGADIKCENSSLPDVEYPVTSGNISVSDPTKDVIKFMKDGHIIPHGINSPSISEDLMKLDIQGISLTLYSETNNNLNLIKGYIPKHFTGTYRFRVQVNGIHNGWIILMSGSNSDSLIVNVIKHMNYGAIPLNLSSSVTANATIEINNNSSKDFEITSPLIGEEIILKHSITKEELKSNIISCKLLPQQKKSYISKYYEIIGEISKINSNISSGSYEGKINISVKHIDNPKGGKF
ncbi:hypothetical protein SAMN02745174_01385 [Cetobacterium ceti]|uniref:Uncharacterized protein n=1 Tax=Cetobacterium ceti TaxID=180163 RepID=A0A1T4MZE0_9FUSO|nr:hypothetical protein [Cetobacterium ceti]SJZ72135.1 hypothetical protein SAMN02745174_01385 [Cetobacterium ceti]